MDDKGANVNPVLKEVQCSNKFILKRLGQVEKQDGHCTPCSFHQVSGGLHMAAKNLQKEDDNQGKALKQIQDEISELQSRLSQMAEREEKASLNLETVHEDEDQQNTNAQAQNTLQDDALQSVETLELDNQIHSGVDNSETIKHVQDFSEQASAAVAPVPDGSVDKDSIDDEPQVLHQTQIQRVMAMHWDLKFSFEIDQAKMGPLKELGGIHDVICLDISESMSENGAWRQAKTFVQDYIKGLKKMQIDAHLYREHVALVTFGHETNVVQRFTNKMDDILTKLDNIKLGGPSPLYGGIKMALAAGGSSENQICVMEELLVQTKIILVTDGHFTEMDVIAGPDVPPRDMEQAASATLNVVQELTKYRLELVYVPVGKANMDFLQLACAITDGRVLPYTDGEQFSRQSYLTMMTANPQLARVTHMLPVDKDSGDFLVYTYQEIESLLGTDLPGSQQPPSLRLTHRDMEEIKYIKKHTPTVGDEMKKDPRLYRESSSDKFPPLGTRVRRGPDWNSQNEDREGAGTIIGHIEKDDRVWVQWDANVSGHHYRYAQGRYEVLPVSEPRAPRADGELLVGCIVKPTSHCQDSKIKPFDRGTIIFCEGSSRVKVRWNNGATGNYTVCPADKCEVQYSPPFEQQKPTSNAHGDLKNTRKQKSKNKNV